MAVYVLFVNMLNVLIVSTLWTPGSWATDLNTRQGYHNVSDWHCVIQDASIIVKAFESEVIVGKRRALNLTIRRQSCSKTDGCQNTSREDISNSYLMWAASEKEPYLFLPSDFLLFSAWISLHFRQTIEIHMNCVTKIRSAPLNKHKGISLSNAVIRSIRKKLMRTTGGTLCSPLISEEKIDVSFKCCQMDKSQSGIACTVVDPPKYILWFQILSNLWVSACCVVAIYLPGVFCLFPSGPKVSKDGTACIRIGDPSPAGIHMVVAKAFFNTQKMKSWKDKAFVLLLRVVVLPIITGAPMLFLTMMVTFTIQPPAFISYIAPMAATIMAIAYITGSIYSVFWPNDRAGELCRHCRLVFFEDREHSDLREKMEVHTSRQVEASINLCSRFMSWYYKKTSQIFECELILEWKSLVKILWSFCCIFYLFVILVVVSIGFFLGCAVSIVIGFSSSFPMLTFIKPREGRQLLHMFLVLVVALWLTCNTLVCGVLIPFFLMATIDNEHTVLPRLSLALLILYYFHIYFTNFSEKYQLVKLKLYEGIIKHQQSDGDRSSGTEPNAECQSPKNNVKPLLLDTTEGNVALPEELYEAACEELHLHVKTDALWALMKIGGLLLLVFSFFCSVMIFADRFGTGDLIKLVAVFLAAALPKLFSLFSSGNISQTLENFDIEKQLETFITRYAAGLKERSKMNKNKTLHRLLIMQGTPTERTPLL